MAIPTSLQSILWHRGNPLSPQQSHLAPRFVLPMERHLVPQKVLLEYDTHSVVT